MENKKYEQYPQPDAFLLPETPFSYENYRSSDNVHLVIDNGSYLNRVGWSSDEEPKIIVRNTISRDRSKNSSGVCVGFDGNEVDGNKYSMRNTHESGVLVKSDIFESVMDMCLLCLGIDDDHLTHPVILTENPGNPQLARNSAAELFFETYQTPSLGIVVDALSSSFHWSRLKTKTTTRKTALSGSSELVLSYGHSGSFLLPIVNGNLLASETIRSPVGGEECNRFLHLLMLMKYPEFKQVWPSYAAISALRHRMCKVSQDFDTELSEIHASVIADREVDDTLYFLHPGAAEFPIDASARVDPAVEEDRKKKRHERMLKMIAARSSSRSSSAETKRVKMEEGTENVETKSTAAPNRQSAALKAAEQVRKSQMEAKNKRKAAFLEEMKVNREIVNQLKSEQSSLRTEIDSLDAMISRLSGMTDSSSVDDDIELMMSRADRVSELESELAVVEEKLVWASKLSTSADSVSKMEKAPETKSVWSQLLLLIGGLVPTPPLLSFNVERILIPETLFNPSLVGINSGSLCDCVGSLVKRYSMGPYDEECFGILRDWGNNIFVTGGLAKTPGLVGRIERELRSAFPSEIEMNISVDDDTLTSAWKGASMIAKESPDVFLAREDYLECGEYVFQKPHWFSWNEKILK